jgi:iron complex transport system permease protein
LIALWQRQGGDGALLMILVGIIVGTVFQALVSMVKVAADPTNTLPAITFWLMGGLAAVTGHDLWVAAVPMASGLAALTLLRWRLNVLSFGDDEARALGIDVDRTRLAVIVAATVVTAAAVAVAGVIGLVGLVVPHLARMLVGPNYKILLPTCTILGAGFLLAVDDLARTLFSGEIPLGILTSLLGAPVFLLLLVKTGKGWTR